MPCNITSTIWHSIEICVEMAVLTMSLHLHVLQPGIFLTFGFYFYTYLPFMWHKATLGTWGMCRCLNTMWATLGFWADMCKLVKCVGQTINLLGSGFINNISDQNSLRQRNVKRLWRLFVCSSCHPSWLFTEMTQWRSILCQWSSQTRPTSDKRLWLAGPGWVWVEICPEQSARANTTWRADLCGLRPTETKSLLLCLCWMVWLHWSSAGVALMSLNLIYRWCFAWSRFLA